MKNGTALAFVAIGSALIGFAAGVKYTNHLDNVKRQERIDRVKRNVQSVRKVEEESTPQKTQTEDIFETKTEEKDQVDYSQYLDLSKKYDKSEDFDRISVEFPDIDEDDEDEEDVDFLYQRDKERPPIEVVEAMVNKKKTPYQISDVEFMANELDYDQVTWFYYSHDGIVLDFFDNVVDYEIEFIDGARELLDTMQDDDAVFWRSPLHRTEVELILNRTPIAETAVGKKEEKQRAIAERRKKNEDEGA